MERPPNVGGVRCARQLVERNQVEEFRERRSGMKIQVPKHCLNESVYSYDLDNAGGVGIYGVWQERASGSEVELSVHEQRGIMGQQASWASNSILNQVVNP